MKKNLIVIITLALTILSQSGCLKTRAQLRDESDHPEVSNPIPLEPVQDVQPQGKYAIDEMKSEMTQMEGRIEELERVQKEAASSSPLSSIREDLKKLDLRITDLEKNQALTLENVKKIQESSSVSDPDEVFSQAKSLYENSKYNEAAGVFSTYLKMPKAKEKQEATFLRGECYFKNKEYKKAIVDYSKFSEKWTHSKRSPEALYRIGQSFDALGMREEGKSFYQEVIEKYPKSPEAKKLKKKKLR